MTVQQDNPLIPYQQALDAAYESGDEAAIEDALRQLLTAAD